MVVHKNRLIFIILALLFATIVTSWLLRTQLAEYVATTSMQQVGLNDITTRIQSIERQQSQISLLAFTLHTETGQLRLEAQDISISYQPSALMAGQLKDITIKKLALDYLTLHPARDKDGSNATNNSLEPVRAIATLRQVLRDYLLIESLSIENIMFNGEVFSELQEKHFQLNSTVKDQTLYSELFLLENSLKQQSLYFSLNSQFLNTELRSRKQGATLPVWLKLKIEENKITGSYAAEPMLLKHWLQPFVSLKEMDLLKTVHGTIAFHFDQSGEIKTSLTAATEKIAYKSYHADDIALRVKFVTADKTPLQNIQLAKGSSLSVGTFSYQKLLLNDNKIHMAGNLKQQKENWQFVGGLKFNRFKITHNSKNTWIKGIDTSLNINEHLVDIRGDFTPDEVPAKFSFSVSHDLDKSSGQFTLRQRDPVNFSAESDKLSELWTPWPYPFDLLTGKIYLDSDAQWSPDAALLLTTNIKLVDVGGNINELLFSNLSFEHSVEVLPELRSVETSEIHIAHIDSGVSIDNIRTNLTIESTSEPQPRLVLNSLYGEIFNGTFSSKEIIYDLNRSNNTFNIDANNIDLAEIVKTQQLNDIEVTGKISGQIPVELTGKGLFIKDGAFINDVTNGTIRYNPVTGTEQLKQNPLTGIALDALKDFRYSHLSADVNFTPEGILAVGLQLKGISPELDTERPVHLNIKTEQNLLSLLKSLRYAQGISNKIDDRVRQQYEKTQ